MSREDELALAKRIDAAQSRLLGALCRVPLAIDMIAGWVAGVREGRLRSTYLLDSLRAPEEIDMPRRQSPILDTESQPSLLRSRSLGPSLN